MMKKFILAILLFYGCFTFSQNVELEKLSTGELINFSHILTKEGDLYGYISLYDLKKKGQNKTKEFEYVILDKNLNPVANKKFSAEEHVTSYIVSTYINNKGITLTPPKMQKIADSKQTVLEGQTLKIRLDDNSIESPTFISMDENNKVVFSDKNISYKDYKDKIEAQKKANKYYNSVNYSFLPDDTYLVTTKQVYDKYESNNVMIKFDANQQEEWRYSYNNNGNAQDNERIKILDTDANNIYFLKQIQRKDHITTYLEVISLKTGKQVAKNEIKNANINTLDHFFANFNSYLFSRKFEDRNLYILFTVNDEGKEDGFMRVILDKKNYTFNTLAQYFDEGFKQKIPALTKDLEFANGYRLLLKDALIFENNSVGLLFEKVKFVENKGVLSENIVIATFDQDFDFSSVHSFKKDELLITSTYLYSQYLKQNNGAVFYYLTREPQDETKKSKTYKLSLNINSIVDNKLRKDVLPLIEDENKRIIPYLAKEGYILLNEQNRKDKTNTMRLERLNF